MSPLPDHPAVPPDTVLTDRAMLLHILQHVEYLHDKVEAIFGLLDELEPLIDKAKAHGRRGARLFGASQAAPPHRARV